MIEDIFFGDERFKKLLNGLYEGVYVVDRARKIRFWNEGAERITGYSSEEVEGLSCGDSLLVHMDRHGKELCSSMCPLAHTLEDKKSRQDRIYLNHKAGHRLPVAIRVMPLEDDKGHVTGAIEIFSEISSELQLEERVNALERMALLDAVTELPNRRYLEDHIKARLAERRRYGHRFGVLFIDIDRFKDLNDRYGHEKGDQVLKVVSKTLAYSVRASDVVGRWGGEEFVGVFPNIDREELLAAGKRLLSLIAHSKVKNGEKDLTVTVSVGAAYAREDDTVHSIIKRADSMMYESKKKGRGVITMEH